MNNSNDPLHGIKLEKILVDLEKELGWEKMGELLNIRCFTNKPRFKSSLKFLRTTPWARSKVEILYLKTFHKANKSSKKLIQAILTNKNKVEDKQSNDLEGFVWPSIKNKKN